MLAFAFSRGTMLEMKGAPAAAAPDFKEVYELLKQHATGLSDEQLNQAAVQGLLSALGPRASLIQKGETSGPFASPLVSRVNSFDQGYAYLRVERVADGLESAIREACDKISSTNKIKGIVLDLRYAAGDDYAGAVATANLFIAKAKPLLDWGQGMVSSKENRDSFKVPVAVLVNSSTAGAAEALAAVLRESGTGLLLGSKTAGQASVTRQFPLKNGDQLRIAIAPIRLGNAEELNSKGVEPDIKVDVNAADERAYYADAFRLVAPGNQQLGSRNNNTNLASRRLRFNEAELVRERREGGELDPEGTSPRKSEPDKPLVYDPALARALDLLKGLSVVRQAPA